MKFHLLVNIVSVTALSATAIAQDPFADPEPAPPQLPKPAAEPAAPVRPDDPFVRRDGRSTPVAPDGQRNVMMLAEFIKIEETLLADMLQSENLDASDGTAVRAAVERLLDAGKVTMLDSLAITSLSGHRAKAESIREIIYPVEWDPPAKFSGVKDTNQPDSDPIVKRGVPMIVEGKAYWPPAQLPHPTVWEMRPAGTILETDGNWSEEGLLWEAAAAPEIVAYLEDTSSGSASLRDGLEPLIKLPHFATVRSMAQFTSTIGDTVWLGTHSSSKLGHVMTFVRPLTFKKPPENPAGTNRDEITLIVESILAPSKWTHQYFSGLESSAVESKALREQLDALIKKGEAEIDTLSTLRCKSGGTVESEGVNERIYATEYDPPTTADFNLPEDADIRFWPASCYPNPTAHETRNVGVTVKLSVGPSSSRNHFLIDLHYGQVAYVGERIGSRIETPRGKETVTSMPIFATSRIIATVSCREGETVLLGYMTPRNSKGEQITDKRMFVFLRVAG